MLEVMYVFYPNVVSIEIRILKTFPNYALSSRKSLP